MSRIVVAHVSDLDGVAEIFGHQVPAIPPRVLQQEGVTLDADAVEWATNRRPADREDGRIELSNGFFALHLPDQTNV